MTGKKHILAILILAGICLLCACGQTTKENADIASEIHAGIADPAAAEKPGQSCRRNWIRKSRREDCWNMTDSGRLP